METEIQENDLKKIFLAVEPTFNLKPLPSNNPIECISAMSEGNPGGLSVMMQIVELIQSKISSENMQSLFISIALQLMYNAGITGSRIWLGYKDLCECDLIAFLTRLITDTKMFIRQIRDLPQ